MKRFTVVLIIKQSNVFKRTGIIIFLVTIKVVLRSSKWLQWVQKQYVWKPCRYLVRIMRSGGITQVILNISFN
jgi:hypothetical protein